MFHLRMAVMHLPTKFDANSSVQFRVMVTFFFEIQHGGHRRIGFSSYVKLAHSGMLIVRYMSCSVPNLV